MADIRYLNKSGVTELIKLTKEAVSDVGEKMRCKNTYASILCGVTEYQLPDTDTYYINGGDIGHAPCYFNKFSELPTLGKVHQVFVNPNYGIIFRFDTRYLVEHFRIYLNVLFPDFRRNINIKYVGTGFTVLSGDHLLLDSVTDFYWYVCATGDYNEVSSEYTNGSDYCIVFVAHSLPSMSTTVKGGAKVGSGLAISNSVLRVDSSITDAIASNTSAISTANDAIAELNNKVFPLTVSVEGGGIYEQGTTVSAAIKWTVKKGDDAITPDTLTINGTEVTVTDSSKTYENITETTTYTVAATSGTATASGSTTVKFVYASYFGVVGSDTDVTADTITALGKNIKDKKGYTGTAALSNQKLCYAYPKSYGALTSIKDANNFEYLSSYTRSEVTIDSVAYYAYVLTDPVTITNFKQIYS